MYRHRIIRNEHNFHMTRTDDQINAGAYSTSITNTKTDLPASNCVCILSSIPPEAIRLLAFGGALQHISSSVALWHRGHLPARLGKEYVDILFF